MFPSMLLVCHKAFRSISVCSGIVQTMYALIISLCLINLMELKLTFLFFFFAGRCENEYGMEVLLVPIKINISPDLCLLSLWQQGGWLRGYICSSLPKGLKTSEWPAVFIIKFSKGKLFWSNWSNNVREVISGQFPAAFALQNTSQVCAVQHCRTALPSPECRHTSAVGAIN